MFGTPRLNGLRSQQGKSPIGALREDVHRRFGPKGETREVVGEDGSYVLRESPASYDGILGHENSPLRPENDYFWNQNLCISIDYLGPTRQRAG